jgi:superfamily II DNA or RNA helicase
MWTIINRDNLTEYERCHRLNTLYPEREYILHESSDGKVFLPRYFHKNYPSEKLIHHIDKEFHHDPIEGVLINEDFELREEQKRIFDIINSSYQDNGFINGVINMRTGGGKSALSVYLTTQLKLKTLIIVDNTKLKEQFIGEYLKYTNLKEEDIGVIQGSRFDGDKSVVVTMVQTLLSKVKSNLKEFYIKLRDCGFGLAIYDEVHKTSSGQKYSLSSLLINTPNILGLSATPYHKDYHKMLMENTIGNIICVSKKYELIPKFVYINYDSQIEKKHLNRLRYVKDYIKSQAYYNSIIFDNINYLKIIVRIVNKAVQGNHRILVIVSTTKQMESIVEALLAANIKCKPLYSKQTDVDQETDLVLVATFKYASTGFDYKALSALLLGSPYKGQISLVQAIGRILRECTGKNSPVIFDLMDRQVPSLFGKNITSKNNIYQKEYGNCVIQYVNV